jgi:membrane glycosyltransferase
VPKLLLYEVPEEGRTLVVIPALTTSKTQLLKQIFSLKKIACANLGKHVDFSLLLDYSPSKTEVAKEDEELNLLIQKSLNGHKNLNAFVRRRQKSGNKFAGHERKRGALEALNTCLHTHDTSAFSYIFNHDFLTPTFVVVLDEDSELLPNAVTSAVASMLHPLNRSYDLFAFTCRQKLASINTFYATKYLSDAGVETYSAYTSLYFNLTGQAIFCGKGIYRLEKFVNLINKLPEGKILSHDILEGALLKTGQLADIVYEDAPADFITDLGRKNRWARGDIQNLCMLKRTRGITRFVMVTNVLNLLAPPFAMLAVILGIFLSPFYLLPLALYAGIYVVFELKSILLNSGEKTSIRYIVFDVLLLIKRGIGTIILLPFLAVNNTIITAKTLFRMARKKRLLVWKTFGSSRQNFEATAPQKPPKHAPQISGYLADTYRFFASHEHGLIADFVQINPAAVATQTLPPPI